MAMRDPRSSCTSAVDPAAARSVRRRAHRVLRVAAQANQLVIVHLLGEASISASRLLRGEVNPGRVNQLHPPLQEQHVRLGMLARRAPTTHLRLDANTR
jgi:hypothetical protein